MSTTHYFISQCGDDMFRMMSKSIFEGYMILGTWLLKWWLGIQKLKWGLIDYESLEDGKTHVLKCTYLYIERFLWIIIVLVHKKSRFHAGTFLCTKKYAKNLLFTWDSFSPTLRIARKLVILTLFYHNFVNNFSNDFEPGFIVRLPYYRTATIPIRSV